MAVAESWRWRYQCSSVPINYGADGKVSVKRRVLRIAESDGEGLVGLVGLVEIVVDCGHADGLSCLPWGKREGGGCGTCGVVRSFPCRAVRYFVFYAYRLGALQAESDGEVYAVSLKSACIADAEGRFVVVPYGGGRGAAVLGKHSVLRIAQGDGEGLVVLVDIVVDQGRADGLLIFSGGKGEGGGCGTCGVV